jgi:hypothetical protein
MVGAEPVINGTRGGLLRVESRMTAFFKALATLFSRERLDEDTPPPTATGAEFFTWLFGAEELPKAAVSVPPERESFLAWLLKPVPLPPPESPAEERKPSIFAVIFGRDDLARVPGSAPEEQNYRKNICDRENGTNGAGER